MFHDLKLIKNYGSQLFEPYLNFQTLTRLSPPSDAKRLLITS